MEVSCLFGRDCYHSGGILVACVRVSNGFSKGDCILLAQASGYINVDPKWVKSNDGSSVNFVQSLGPSFDQGIPMPNANVQNTHCIFLTSREVLSTTQLSENGVFLMFALPNTLIPTYKGLSGTVTYSIAVTLQSQGDSIKQIRFPFTLLGGGSLQSPYKIKFSSLAVFGANSIPIENRLLPQIIDDSDDENDTVDKRGAIPINGVIYNIRDNDLICSLSMINQGEILHPGGLLTIRLLFEDSLQPCKFIRACIQQCENRIDGSRVQSTGMFSSYNDAHSYLNHFSNERNLNITLMQSKIVVEAHRSADGAELIYLRLHLPHNLPCSFTTPIFKVSYQIVLEFYLDDDEESSHTKIDVNSKNEHSKFHTNDGKKSFRKTLEPFTWNLPIDINIRKYPLDTVSEINSCFDPVSENVLNFP